MATAVDIIRTSQGQTAAPALAASVQDWLDEAADMGSARLEGYDLYESFYDGEHATELTDRLQEFLTRQGVDFAENFCEPMVDMVAERLTVTGFEASIDGDPDGNQAAEVAQWLAEEWWTPGHLDEHQSTVHTQTLILGDGFGVIGFDNTTRRPTFSWNPPDRMKAVYDSDGHMSYAVKVWTSDDKGPSNPAGRTIARMNVYWPDRIEKFYKLHSSVGKGGWAQWHDEPDGDEPTVWPTPWVDTDGRPLGIPVVHFRNRSRGRDYGRSELAGGVIPQQLALNKQVIDLLAILDYQGWPQRYASGISKDEARDLKTAPGELWTAKGDAKFGEFPTADLDPILAAIENTISRMARRSGMPLHLLTGGDIPSGEAMKTAESRLVARCKDRSTSYGNRWEDAAVMAIKLAALADALPFELDLAELTLHTVWANPASRDELAEASTFEAHHRLGVSKHTILTKLGYQPDDEAGYRAEEDRQAATTARRLFNSGGFGDGFGGDDPPGDNEGDEE